MEPFLAVPRRRGAYALNAFWRPGTRIGKIGGNRPFTQVTRGLPAEPGDVSLHHTLIAHSSRSNRSDDWRIGIGITISRPERPISGRPGCRRSWRGAPTASTISITKPRPGRTQWCRACRICRLTVPLSESGVGCCGDAPYSL